MREAVKRACIFLLVMWCFGTGSDAAPSTNLSTTVTGDDPSTAILVAVGESSHEHTVLRKWADLERGSTANHLAVWALCLKGSSTESSVRELPDLLPFVVEESYSWATIIREFSVQNPTVTAFGLIAEGSLPYSGLTKAAIYVEHALAGRSTPTAMVARSRSKNNEDGGVREWLPDTFMAQLWFNRHPELASHGFGLDHLALRDSRSLLATIPLMVYQMHGLADSIIVDGTSFTSLVYDGSSHEQENTKISFRNAAAANRNDLYIGRLKFALVLEKTDKHFARPSISAAPWPPQYVLDTVAGEGGLVLMNNVNCGYLDLATNLLRSIQRVSDAKVLWVAMDDVAFDFMDAVAPGCTAMFPFDGSVVPHATKAGAFGDDLFKAEVLVRPRILRAILQRGHPLLWTDSDMVWLRNPLGVLPKVDDPNAADLMLMIDGSPENLCTCLLFMKPVPATKTLLTLWENEIIETNVQQDQAAFEHPVVLALFQGMKMDIFGSESFPSGKYYFDHPFQENDPAHDNVLVVHNNFIKGHDSKVERFKEYHLWDVGSASFPECGERL